MQYATIPFLAHLHNLGHVKNVSIQQSFMDDSWTITFAVSGALDQYALAPHHDKSEPRLFKSLDGAVSVLRKIGVKPEKLLVHF